MPAGSGDFGSRFHASVAGDAVDFLLFTREGDTDQELVQQVNPDFALSRTLDSFSPIVDMYADNGFIIFTESGEWSIQGNFQAGAMGTGTARARRYSTYGAHRRAGVASIDNQVFFSSRKAAFAIKFQGDDIGYPDAVDITARRNEEALAGELIRIGAAQPEDLTGSKMVFFLCEDGGKRYISTWHTESLQEHFAWSQWTFPSHFIVDMAVVDNRVFVLADLIEDGIRNTAKRAVYVFSAAEADTAGMAGDQTDADERAAFPVVLETPSVEAVPIAGDAAFPLPTQITRQHIYCLKAGGLTDDDRLMVRTTDPDGEEVVQHCHNLLFGETAPPDGMPYGKRVVDGGARNLSAQNDYHKGFRVLVEQTNLHPFHFLRLDTEGSVGAASL